MNTNTADYLTDEIKDKLYGYQIDNLNRTIVDYLRKNEESSSVVWKSCPKCHAEGVTFSPGGYTQDKYGNRKKPMLKCDMCRRRFVVDHGQLTFYSHSDSSVWNRLIEDTFEGKSLEATAAEINRHPVTVFHMRHKFLAALEAENEETVLTDTAEADEKYVHECHKGLVNAVIDRDHKLIYITPGSKKDIKPGICDDKTCIITAVQRLAGSYIHTQNMGKPSSEDIECLDPHIKDGTFVFTDGATAYESVLNHKGCHHKALKSTASYDSLNHLNNVNSLHSKMDEWFRNYRNVNTIYINRYNALFALRQKYAGADFQETVINVLRWLRGKVQYHFIRQQQEDIFDDPAAIKPRQNLTAIAHINWLKSKRGYSILYA